MAAPSSAGPRDDERREGPGQRADRQMSELLQELRVAQIGVTILFAGLISVSFTERFARIDSVQRWTYVVAVLLTVVSTGLLIAPAAVHRLNFSIGVKPQIVHMGHRLFQAGLATLALSLVAAVLLVLEIALGRALAIPLAGTVLVVLVGLWFVLPLPVRRAAERAARS